MNKALRVLAVLVVTLIPMMMVAQPGGMRPFGGGLADALRPGDGGPGPGGAVIGPEGNFYFIAVTAGTSGSAATYTLKAVQPTATPTFLWTAVLTGPAEVEPGTSTVYVVQHPVAGSTATTSAVNYLNSNTGQLIRSVDIAGIARGIRVKTVGATEYLYVNWHDATSSSSTTAPAAHLSIYTSAGVKIKQVDF